MAELRQAPAIEAYGSGGFRIDGVRHEGSILILNDMVIPWAGEASPEGLSPVFKASAGVVEFVLLGLGTRMAPPPKGLRQALQQVSIGLEVQTTAEAVRLYNLLAEDGRRMAAALIAV
jgi:uncharacterized protein